MVNIAWAAGFIDGEGCISIAKQRLVGDKWYYSLKLTASQTKIEPLELLKNKWGGSITVLPAKLNRQQCYTWQVYSENAKLALLELQPYLVVKQRQAAIGIGFQKAFKRRNLVLVERLKLELTKLNRRGNK